MPPSPAAVLRLQGQSPPLPPGSLAFWQSELASANAQLAGLRVEADQLQHQLKQSGGHASPELESRATQVSLETARTEGEIARIQAQIAAKQGIATTGSPPPFGARDRTVDPRMAASMVFVLTLAVMIPLAVALARRIARGGTRSASSDVGEIAPRLDRLEHAVDSIAIEVERISEGQRFVTKILAEQPQIKAGVNAGKPFSG